MRRFMTFGLAILAVGMLILGGVPAQIRGELSGEIIAIPLIISRIEILFTEDPAVAPELITIVEQAGRFDLLALKEGVLAALDLAEELPVGFVSQIHLTIVEAKITINGFQERIFVAGGKIILNGEFEVTADGTADVVFDFDADKSVIQNPGQGFVLKPVIQVMPLLVLDQSNDPATGTSFGCGDTGLSLYQSFTPSASPLMAVELRLRAGGNFPEGGVDVTVQIRDGSPDGTVLGTSSAFVEEGPLAAGTQVLILFSFEAIDVTTGNSYVLEGLNPTAHQKAHGLDHYTAELSYMGSTDNPYADGNMYGCGGAAVPDYDLNFRTFTV